MLLHRALPVFNLRNPLTIIAAWALLEALMWLAVQVASETRLAWFDSSFRSLSRSLSANARRRGFTILFVFLVIFVGRLALLPILHIPPPRFTDEFSQVLSADTFAHWRVTNPTHPLWRNFETFMENQRPTYHSMYPPATGLVMAAAQILTGQPWYGMLFAVAAAGAGVCWMLQGWMPPRWAMWGSLVFVLYAAANHLTEFYVGEGITILAGALILGAVPRIAKHRRFGSVGWVAVGVALLVMSRPYEGAFLVSGVAIGGAWWAYQSGITAATLARKVALPVCLALVPAFLGLGYLNWKTTGNALLAPYEVNLAHQHITRPLIWQRPSDAPPQYDYSEMAAFYQQWEVGWWNAVSGFPRGFARFIIWKLQVLYYTGVWPLAGVVAIGSYQLLKRRTLRFLPFVLGFYLLGLGLESYQLLSWYIAPARALLILLAVYGVRGIGVWRRQRHQGLRISHAARVMIPAALLASMIVSFGSAAYGVAHPYPESYSTARQQLLEGLESLPGKQLVIVRYAPSHIPFEEWVENGADIDAEKVVWARDVPGRGDADLLSYFKDRTAWVLEPDGDRLKLTPCCGDNVVAAVDQIGGFSVFRSDRPCAELSGDSPVAFR